MKIERAMLVVGSALAKCSPVLFGLALTRYWGHEIYAYFVLMINFSAFISSLPTLGSVPQILSAGLKENRNEEQDNNIKVSFVLLVAIIVGYLFYWLFFQRNYTEVGFVESWSWVVSIGLLSVGLVCYGLSNALLSSNEKWLEAALGALVVYMTPVLLIISVAAGREAGGFLGREVVPIYAGLFAFLSFAYFIRARGGRKNGRKGVLFGYFWSGLTHVKVSLFGVAYLLGFYLVAAKVNAEMQGVEPAIYSLSFQLFSITIFIPSVLGSVVVPLMSNRNGNKSFDKRRFERISLFLYLAVSLFFCGFIILTAEWIVNLYDFSENKSVAINVIMLMQVAAVLASVVAKQVQSFIVSGKYLTLSIGGIIWIVALLLYVDFSLTLEECTQGFVFAYMLLFLFYLAVLKFEKIADC